MSGLESLIFINGPRMVKWPLLIEPSGSLNGTVCASDTGMHVFLRAVFFTSVLWKYISPLTDAYNHDGAI